MLGINRRAVIALGAAGLLAAAGLVTVAFAQTPTPTAGAQRTNYGEVFTAKLAGALGVDQSRLTDAVKKAQSDTIDEAVARGDLAKNRADEMKQRLPQGGPGLFGPFGGPGFPGGKGDRMGPGPRGMIGPHDQAVQEAIAAKLGVTIQDLRTQLRSGKSLLDLAKEKGVSETAVRATIQTALKGQLDKAVADGKLTQARADEMLKRSEQMPLPLDGKRGPR
jgi:uncharacterized protein YidB (DUF937 family)